MIPGPKKSFTVYDHPTVTLYQKTPRYSRELAASILQPDRADTALSAAPGDAATNSLLLSPSAYARQQSGGTWSSVFRPDGSASSLPWLWWLVWLQLASFAAVPWVTWLCRAAPDRAYGLSKLLGPMAVVLGTWLAVAWGIADFSRGLAWGVFAGALAFGVILGGAPRGAASGGARASRILASDRGSLRWSLPLIPGSSGMESRPLVPPDGR